MSDNETGNQNSIPSLSEQLTANFYRWETRGRGWQVRQDVVDLEPAFEPFFHYYSSPPPGIDDGRRPTFFSSLVENFRGLFAGTGANKQRQPSDEPLLDEPEPLLFEDSSALNEITVSLSAEQKVSADYVEQFLLNLRCCSLPLSFEIVGTSQSSTVQFVCREPDLQQVRQQLNAYFPDAVFYKEGHTLDDFQDCNKKTVVVDFGLSQEFMRPLRTTKDFDPDTLTGIIGAMENLNDGELGILQILFQPVCNPWTESVIRSVTDCEGHSFFTDNPDMVGLAREKIEKPLFAVVIRVVGQSTSDARAWEIARALSGGLATLASPHSNELIPLSNDGYDDSAHAEDVYYRQSRRSGMLLNSQELISLVHPPSVSVRAAKLRREVKKTKSAPLIASGHKFLLGQNVHQSKETVVTLSPEQRLRHMHVIGATGTGKSTLLLKLIIQDINEGRGIAVLDPHGDLIDRILGYIPENRFDDVVLVDPSDSDYPVGLNILSAYSELDKTVLSSDLVGVFRRLSTSWGDQMNSIFANAILAFLESEQGGTLVDLRRFLVEKDFRESFLKTVKDHDVVYYWHQVFRQLTSKAQTPILTRLDTFLRPKPIRYMVAQKHGLNFQNILEGKKIFLAKLSQGLIGMENAYLLGTIIVSKLHQAAMGRQARDIAERENFFLYVDEFQNFVTESMTEILSGARKYHFGLILAHQELRQLSSRDPELTSSVISNPGTRICFRLGDFDAKKLEDGFSAFDAHDLQNLGVGEAVARIERAEYDFNLKTLPPPDIDPQTAHSRQEKIISLSRQKYSLPKQEIEQLMIIEDVQPVEKEKPIQPSIAAPLPEFAEIKEQVEPQIKEEQPLYYRRKKAEADEPSLEGIGGDKHRDIQNKIKEIAQQNGFLSLIEHPTPNRAGKVDVHLERQGIKIACEISVTSTAEQELGNIQKCLAAGYDKVILCSPDEKILNKVRKLILKSLKEPEQPKVLFFLPEEFTPYLKKEAAKAASIAETIRGYHVKSHIKPVTDEKKEAKRRSIFSVLWPLGRARSGK